MKPNDTSLVKPGHPANPRVWVVSFVIAAAILLGYAVNVIAKTPISSMLYGAQTTNERTALKYARYIADETPLLVLTGSSLMDRIEEGYLPPHSHNLAGGGDSPLTGLEFLVSQQRLPRLVIVELNVMSRDLDHHLLNEFAGASKPAVLLRYVRPVRNAAIASTLPDERAWWGQREQELLQQPPSQYGPALRLNLLAALDAEIKKPSTLDAFTKNAERLKDLADQLQARGTKVLYLELPAAEEISNHAYNRERRRILEKTLAPLQPRLADLPRIDDLRYGDGAHPDERSALLIAHCLAALATR